MIGPGASARFLRRCMAAGLLTACAVVAGPGRAEPGQAPPPAQPRVDDRLSAEERTALRALVEAGAHPDLRLPRFGDQREAVARFYASRDEAPGWFEDARVTPQARALVEALAGAAGKGLDPEDYDGARLAERIDQVDDAAAIVADRVGFDVALTAAALRYVGDLRAGRVEARRLGAELAPTLRSEDPAEVLGRLARTPDVAAVLEALEPPFAAYRRTVRALQRYLELAREDAGPALSVPVRPISPGTPYPEAPRLDALLRRLGDLAPDAAPPSDDAPYGGALVRAVRRFQERHGLEPSGLLDARTVGALNTPLSRRVTQLALALERWRAFPRTFAAPPIVVNVPEYRLRAIDPNGRGTISMRVVVGKAFRHQTPLLSAELTAVVFRPYWKVPLSIQREELVPAIRRDPAYLARHGYELEGPGGEVVDGGEITPEVLARLRAGSLRIRQRPGPRNALGLVKFVFPNVHDVYMHGTPSRELFGRSRRDFSHGCIRVEDPEALAGWVLHEAPGWDLARVRAAMQGSRTVQITVARPMPVLIAYGTAVVAEDGTVRFFEDVYGHDAALERALAERRAPAPDAHRPGPAEGSPAAAPPIPITPGA